MQYGERAEHEPTQQQLSQRKPHREHARQQQQDGTRTPDRRTTRQHRKRHQQQEQDQKPDRHAPTREHVVPQRNLEHPRWKNSQRTPNSDHVQPRDAPRLSCSGGDQLAPYLNESPSQEREERQIRRLAGKIAQLLNYGARAQNVTDTEIEQDSEDYGPTPHEDEEEDQQIVACPESHDQSAHQWGLSQIGSSEESESSNESVDEVASAYTYSDVSQFDMSEEDEENAQGDAAERRAKKRYYHINPEKLHRAMSHNSMLSSLSGMTMTEEVGHFMAGAMEQLGEILYAQSVDMLKTERAKITSSSPKKNCVVKLRHLCKVFDTQMHLKTVFERKILEFDPYCSFYVGDMSRRWQRMREHEERGPREVDDPSSNASEVCEARSDNDDDDDDQREREARGPRALDDVGLSASDEYSADSARFVSDESSDGRERRVSGDLCQDASDDCSARNTKVVLEEQVVPYERSEERERHVPDAVSPNAPNGDRAFSAGFAPDESGEARERRSPDELSLNAFENDGARSASLVPHERDEEERRESGELRPYASEDQSARSSRVVTNKNGEERARRAPAELRPHAFDNDARSPGFASSDIGEGRTSRTLATHDEELSSIEILSPGAVGSINPGSLDIEELFPGRYSWRDGSIVPCLD